MLAKNKIARLFGVLLVLMLPLGAPSIAKASTPDDLIPSDSWAVDLGDLDGDGDLDAFVGNQDSVNGTGPEAFNEIWFNNGDATFTYSSQQLGQEDTEAVKLADLDIDGDLDAFTANTTGPIIWINDGNGLFTEGPTLGSAYAYAVDVGDLDGDGDLDAFVGVFGSQDQVWINQGGMNFILLQQVGANEQARHVALDDLDGDSDLDVFVVNHFNGTNIVYLNDGTGHLLLGQTIPNNDAVDLSLGDIDGDGDVDAFVGNSSGEADDLYMNDGAGNFSPSSQIGNYNTEATALGDLDGDGALDVYMGDGFGGANRIWFNNGDGTFFDSGQSLGIYDTFGTALGDLDGDGDLDIFDANKMAETVWLNGGAGTFSFGQFLGEPPPLPEPTLYAEINFEWVDGWNWPLGNWVTLTIHETEGGTLIYGPVTRQVGMHEWDDATYVGFDVWEDEFDLQPGQFVTLTDGTTTKSHTALNIGITQVNVTDNTVTGFAERDTTLSVSAHTPCWETVEVIADGDDYIEEGFAYWQADFDEICELSTVEFVHAEQQGFEEDGVSTGFFWAPPYLGVNIYYDFVFGWSWLPGTEVTLTIDGPDINGTENYTLTKTVGVDTDFTPDTVQFDFRGEFYVQPGHIVTLSDGGVSIVYEVEYLEVTQVDPSSKLVQGLADPYDEVLVILDDPWTESVVSADDDGHWEASFDDFVHGSGGGAQIPAGYENHTSTNWVSPMPTTYNINPWWSEETVRTEDDVFLYVRWGACTMGLVKSFQRNAHIDVTINGEPLYPQGDEVQYWGPIEPIELDACKAAPSGEHAGISTWEYQLSPLEPGIYEVYVHYWLDHPIIDGGDWDGDGKMDKFEGTLVENTITIVVK